MVRSVQPNLPDLRSPEFAAEARRQSLAVANSPQEKADQDFIDAMTDWEGLPDWQDKRGGASLDARRRP
jgi:Protein  of unknown function (DUF3018)